MLLPSRKRQETRDTSWQELTSRAPALAYLRTSSAANVGTDKDSEKRQRHAIQGFAKRAGFGIVDEFYDAAVSGADLYRDTRGLRAPQALAGC